MSKNYAHLEIEETENGWVVTTDWFCYGHNGKHVFKTWKEVIDFVTKAMRKNDVK